jgi:hypothetical protein
MQHFETMRRGQQAVDIAGMLLQHSVRLFQAQAEAASRVLRTSTEQTVSVMRQTNEAMLQVQQIFSRLLTGDAPTRATADDTTQRTRELEQQLSEAMQLTPHETREAAHEVSRHASSAVAQVLNEETAEPDARRR